MIPKNKFSQKNSFTHFPSIHFKNMSFQELQKIEQNLEVVIGIKILLGEKGQIKVN